MKLIEREFYLEKMKNVIGTPDIKVITGVRRSGKSKLLELFKQYVLKSIPEANVIHINFNLAKFEKLKEYHALNEYIEAAYVDGKDNFVLIDEVQLCPNFELTINSLHAEEQYDIYITGLNAFLLSSDLATLFTGRTFEIKVYPFLFQEYLAYFGSQNIIALIIIPILAVIIGQYLQTRAKKREDKMRIFTVLIIRVFICGRKKVLRHST